MAPQSSHLLALARRGAEVRLRELGQEAKHLLEVFPHLRDSFDADELPVTFILAEGARHATTAEPRRGGASAASRRAASARLKRSWKARRKGDQK